MVRDRDENTHVECFMFYIFSVISGVIETVFGPLWMYIILFSLASQKRETGN